MAATIKSEKDEGERRGERGARSEERGEQVG